MTTDYEPTNAEPNADPTNAELCVTRVEPYLRTYMAETGLNVADLDALHSGTPAGDLDELRCAVNDLLCDLYHFAEMAGYDVDVMIEHARWHFVCEWHTDHGLLEPGTKVVTDKDGVEVIVADTD